MNSMDEAPAVAPSKSSRSAQILFSTLMVGFCFVMLIDAMSIDILIDKVFPIIIASIGDMLYSTFSTLSWLLWLLVGTALFGFMIGLTLFLLAYFYYRADLSWKKNVILTIIGVCFVVFLASVLNRDLPPGLLQHFVDLPWPLR